MNEPYLWRLHAREILLLIILTVDNNQILCYTLQIAKLLILKSDFFKKWRILPYPVNWVFLKGLKYTTCDGFSTETSVSYCDPPVSDEDCNVVASRGCTLGMLGTTPGHSAVMDGDTALCPVCWAGYCSAQDLISLLRWLPPHQPQGLPSAIAVTSTSSAI